MPFSHKVLRKGACHHCFRARRESWRFRQGRSQPDSCLPGTFLSLVALPDKERRFDLTMLDLPAPVDEGRKSHGSKDTVRQDPEIVFLVTAFERKGKHFFGKPAIEAAKLFFLTHMLEVVIDDGNVADALFERLAGHIRGKLGSFAVVVNPGEFRALPPEGKTEDIHELAAFIAREANASIGLELQAKMAHPRCGDKSLGRRGIARQKDVQLMAGFARKTQRGQLLFEVGHGCLCNLAASGEEKQVIGVAEVMKGGQAIEKPVERREKEIGEEACDGSAERNALIRPGHLSAILILETNTILQEAEKVILRINNFANLLKKQIMADRGKVAGDIPLRDEQGRVLAVKEPGNRTLAAVEPKTAQSVGIGIAGKPGMQSTAQQTVEEQVNQALFPRVNIQRPAFSSEISVQSDSRPKSKRFLPQRAMQGREVLRAPPGEVVKILLVGRGKQSFAP